jgi:type VI secretion system secreted protein VgrG
MAFVTPKSVQHSAGENLIATARDMDFSIAKRLRMAAGDLISLCAHKLGINLVAAKGKLTASALTDGMDLFAQKQLRIASESADVQVSAKSKITLNSGGASLVIEGGNMTFHCPGAFTIKAGSFTFVGPDNVPAMLPSLPGSNLKLNDRPPHTN